MVNQDQVAGILRILIPAVCTWLAAKGFSAFGDTGLVGQLTAVAIGVAALAWSFLSHTDASRLKSAAAVDPQVQVHVPSSLMASDPHVASLVRDDSVPNVIQTATLAPQRTLP